MKRVRIGMMQMPVVYGDAGLNLQTMEEALRALNGQADLCVFPECLDFGWANEDAAKLATPIPGPVSDHYLALAKHYGVWIAAGLTEAEDQQVYNTALLISSSGEIVLKHRKINILTGVEDVYGVGTRLEVAKTPFGRIALDICADNLGDSTVLGEAFGRMGAQLLLSPCAWAVTPDRDPEREPYGQEWHVPYQMLSKKYGMAVVGVSNVGRVANGAWRGHRAIGNSIAYTARGEVAAVLPYGECAAAYCVIELELLDNPLTGTALSGAVGPQ